MILVDTNVLVALADRSDRDHERCRRWLAQETDTLALPVTVLAEACYLIDRFGGPAAEAQFLDSVGDDLDSSRRFRLTNLTDPDLRRMTELVIQYGDRRQRPTTPRSVLHDRPQLSDSSSVRSRAHPQRAKPVQVGPQTAPVHGLTSQ